MDTFFQTKQYLKYRLTAGTEHDVHSPFVFDFINTILLDKTPFYAFEPIEALRSKLLLSSEAISVLDLGASRRTGTRRISEIAKSSLLPAKYGQMLFRMVNHFRPSAVLELGTSLGITTLYLALPSRKTPVCTIEGSPEIASVAQSGFGRLSCTNIESAVGDFSSELPRYLSSVSKIGLAFIDGNHRYGATMDYFKACLEKQDDDSILIFDDINWSKEMARAWKEISSNEKVTVSIDLFRMGIVFFRQGVPKQHFKLKF